MRTFASGRTGDADSDGISYNDDTNDMASCCRIDPFILTSERTVEPNCCSTKCLRVLFQHTPDLSVVFTTEQKISLLKVAIKKQQVHHLQILLENPLNFAVTRQRARLRFTHGRFVASITVKITPGRWQSY